MIAFGTVVYPGALKYLKEYLNSLEAQTYKDFDLIILSDNIEQQTLEQYTKDFNLNYIIICVNEKKTPADLRVDLLHFAKIHSYELLVFGDADDLFDVNRISEIVKNYKEHSDYAFYYNEVLLFNKSRALGDFPVETNDIEQIEQYNYLGLSNSSINLSLVSEEFIKSLYGYSSFVFDWYLFSRILCSGGKGLYVQDAITLYRIYENNFAGVSNGDQLKKEFEVKKKHYKIMSQYNDAFKNLYQKLMHIDISKIKPVNGFSYWWNNIKL